MFNIIIRNICEQNDGTKSRSDTKHTHIHSICYTHPATPGICQETTSAPGSLRKSLLRLGLEQRQLPPGAGAGQGKMGHWQMVLLFFADDVRVFW